MKKIILPFIGLVLCNIAINAQTVTLDLIGKVTYIEDFRNELNNAVHVDDTITGTIIYYTNIPDSDPDSTIGDYFNIAKPAGISVSIDTFTFHTDTGRIDFLVETQRKPSNEGGNAITFRSDSNIFSVPTDYPNKSLSWQLIDPFGTALISDSLITEIDLNQFEQNDGLTIQADSSILKKGYLISGMITEIIYTVRDIDNNILKIDSSAIVYDTIIEADTTLPAIKDFDGNQYKTVKIGDQIWLRDNLKSIHYSDGNAIERVRVYNDNEANAEIYGRMYTWNACMRGSYSSIRIPSGVQGVCPSGWHVPSDNEWYKLIKYLGGSDVAGGKMKEADTIHWENPNVIVDSSGLLNVLPAGYISSGNSYYQGYNAVFWTTAEYFGVNARYVFLDNQTSSAAIYNDGIKESNFSVRCIKDNDIFDTTDNPIDTLDDDTLNNDTLTAILSNTLQNDAIDIYPNPTSRILYIDGLTEDGIVSLFDISGNILIDRKSITNFIDIHQFSNGIYIIRIEDKKGVTIRRIIKQ